MAALIHTLEGLPGFVGQLDLHQHFYDTNIVENLVFHGQEYLKHLQVLYMQCVQAMDLQETIDDLWTLFGMVQRKLIRGGSRIRPRGPWLPPPPNMITGIIIRVGRAQRAWRVWRLVLNS